MLPSARALFGRIISCPSDIEVGVDLNQSESVEESFGQKNGPSGEGPICLGSLVV
jgi:hypothetical protein